ncbi:hypothetical protein CYLTODRAFT_438856 [Cylindrobasidium torrendii FP15055 ss-10]|uniref:C2H2-type domain-containing protein n=1 Tax=Cylindrobasidium torrendii FP15055 ss-10 TaxID=1314674 RepID=A0A0D7AW17_9AGAR|nr:hypothetical protein CYLTODRAFT_438856 [Cylindrobasidium torrendii FP15055 ss-10]
MAPHLRTFNCSVCHRPCHSQGGLLRHKNAMHREVTQEPDEDGDEAPPAEFAPFDDRISFDFAHFHFVEQQHSTAAIEKAMNMQAALLAKNGVDPANFQWSSADDMYKTIDELDIGAVEWQTFRFRYTGPLPPNPPKWMTDEYELITRDSLKVLRMQLACRDFDGHIHYSPYRQFKPDGTRVFSDLMSGDWAWSQCNIIMKNPALKGTGFIPVIGGSDKTTVSTATGNQAYHPFYQGIGNLDNTSRRAHNQGIIPTAFLPIPKVPKEVQQTKEYQTFTRQLYHACLALIFEPLRPGMTTPEVVQCPDRHFRRAIFGLGPYIADYPEQVLLSCVVSNWCPKCTARPENLDHDPDAILRTHEAAEFLIENFDPGIIWSDYGVRSDVEPFTVNFPRANIHELLSPDLLHQLIKGTFKDHLVEWVNEWLVLEHGEAGALVIIKDIDRRISAVPSFPGLRRFPDGRNFAQWTGNDSKALMKVYLAAVSGYIPPAMVRALSAFMDFCYLVRRNAIDQDALRQIQAKLDEFHHYRRAFIEAGVRDTISLPRQHSLTHYPRSIVLFGSPNGLCSSITESKHIKAVKQPWRRSNHNDPLNQMVQTLTRIDKMAAKVSELRHAGHLEGTTLSYTIRSLEDGFEPTPLAAGNEDSDDEDEDQADENRDMGPVLGLKTFTTIALASTRARGYPSAVNALANHMQQPRLAEALQRYIFEFTYPQLQVPDDVDQLPALPHLKISVFHSAVAKFYAPSDTCGAGGMYRERIRSTPSWQKKYDRRDTVFVVTDIDAPGMEGMLVARVLMFFSFIHNGVYHPCALVHWLLPEEVDPHTGYHVVRYEEIDDERPVQVVGLDAVARGAHLLPIYGSRRLPENFHHSDALNAFRAFYVNRHADHHTHEFI